MAKQISYNEALHKAAALCTASEKCESEVWEKLRKWEVSEQDAEKIITYLAKERFIDEQRYAGFFVRDKFRFNKWGKIKIAYALKHKGISSEQTQEALTQIEDEDYFNLLKDLLKAKSKNLKYKDEADRQAKLFRFAQSRGFENQWISKAIKQIK